MQRYNRYAKGRRKKLMLSSRRGWEVCNSFLNVHMKPNLAQHKIRSSIVVVKPPVAL